MDGGRSFCFLMYQIFVTVSEGCGFLEEMFQFFLISFCKGGRGREVVTSESERRKEGNNGQEEMV